MLWHEDESAFYYFAYFITKVKRKHLNAQNIFIQTFLVLCLLMQYFCKSHNLLITYTFILMQLTLLFVIAFKICTMLPNGNQKCTCLQVLAVSFLTSLSLRSPGAWVWITVCWSSAEAQRPVGTPCARTEGPSAGVPCNCPNDLGHKSPKLLADMLQHHLSVHTWMSLPYR